jgi:hypothetical protein
MAEQGIGVLLLGFNLGRLNQLSGAITCDEYYCRCARGDLFASTHKTAEQSTLCCAKLDPSTGTGHWIASHVE